MDDTGLPLAWRCSLIQVSLPWRRDFGNGIHLVRAVLFSSLELG